MADGNSEPGRNSFWRHDHLYCECELNPSHGWIIYRYYLDGSYQCWRPYRWERTDGRYLVASNSSACTDCCTFFAHHQCHYRHNHSTIHDRQYWRRFPQLDGIAGSRSAQLCLALERVRSATGGREERLRDDHGEGHRASRWVNICD